MNEVLTTHKFSSQKKSAEKSYFPYKNNFFLRIAKGQRRKIVLVREFITKKFNIT